MKKRAVAGAALLLACLTAVAQIGADLVAKARPDGHTLLMGNIGTRAINPSLHPKLPHDPDKAFAPISLVAEPPLAMLVNPAVPARTAQEFVALARSQPGKLSYGSSGAGGAPHLAAEMRVPALPEVPTLAEAALPGFNAIRWIGLLAPADTPREVVDKFATDLCEIIGDDDVKSRLVELGGVPRADTPAQFAQMLATDRERYARIIHEHGITVD